MPDQSSIHTVIVLKFNPAEGQIDSEIIAVHRIVSNMKKRGKRRLAGDQKGGARRALDRWWTVVRNSYGVSRVNETREEKERMISRGREMIWNWWVYRNLEGLGCRVPHLECIKDSRPFFYCATSPVSRNVPSSRTRSRVPHSRIGKK